MTVRAVLSVLIFAGLATAASAQTVTAPDVAAPAVNLNTRIQNAAAAAAVAALKDNAVVLAAPAKTPLLADAAPTGDIIHPQPGVDPLTAARSHDLAAYKAATARSTPAEKSLRKQILAMLDGPDAKSSAVGGTYAADAAPAAGAPALPQGSDQTTATTPSTHEVDDMLSLKPLSQLSGQATGLSAGTVLALPDTASLDARAADAIVRAFQAAPGTANEAATDAADTASGDPALDERIGLARTVFKVDGTDELLRHFVATNHMKLIIQEVNKHIPISKLSETDKYRLSAIAASAETELQEKILNMNARVEATYLSKQDLTLLIVAFDNDAQRKVTRMRLDDTGKNDRAAELDITMAQYQIVKSYEAQ